MRLSLTELLVAVILASLGLVGFGGVLGLWRFGGYLGPFLGLLSGPLLGAAFGKLFRYTELGFYLGFIVLLPIEIMILASMAIH